MLTFAMRRRLVVALSAAALALAGCAQQNAEPQALTGDAEASSSHPRSASGFDANVAAEDLD